MADWIMKGLPLDDPLRIRTAAELANWVEEIGFLPFFAGEVPGFSAEEHVAAEYWWTGEKALDPWEWREVIAAEHRVAYGKFFDGRAGFISRQWLPVFANARRNGYDFDGKWQSGGASRREKALAGFGKGGEKNYPGVLTGLQMQLYLVIGGFRRRENKRGEAYGMAVSVLQAPETIWGYEALSAAYREDPADSWQRIYDHVKARFPADEAAILRLIGRRPAN